MKNVDKHSGLKIIIFIVYCLFFRKLGAIPGILNDLEIFLSSSGVGFQGPELLVVCIQIMMGVYFSFKWVLNTPKPRKITYLVI